MITFTCPTCGKAFNVRNELAGRDGRCACGAVIQVPSGGSGAQEAHTSSIPTRTTPTPPTAKTPNANAPVNSPPQYIATKSPQGVQYIPLRNVPALISYYIGIFALLPTICGGIVIAALSFISETKLVGAVPCFFSLLPFFGAIVGVVAIILGIKGISVYRRSPEVRGKAHALTGIICGSLCGILALFLGLWILISMLTIKR
ncbi:MAG: hypothetical protein WCJ97_02690 [Phycisphaerae bacterium]